MSDVAAPPRILGRALCPGGCGCWRPVVGGPPRIEAHVDGGWLCWGGAMRSVAWSHRRRVSLRWRAAP